ncbi:MAG: ATP-dependent Clp protease proteolytic subunit [Pseudomonadales bacterium]|jgi:ClpP class serine protease|nr:ATP-dependent Clp protease proteolytic subunit [Pseudomonadales bacterium]
MTAIDLFWIFFILMALQPLVRQRALEVLRQRRLADFEKGRRSRAILLVHRQETMRLLGFPLMRFIDVGDAEALLRAIHLTSDDVPIDLILHTPGGLVLPSVQIARALKDHPAKVTVFVPHYAMSGGTLIALAADEVVLCRHAVLGPVDPQLGQVPAASILRVLKDKPVEQIDDETLVLADMARKAIFELRRTVAQLLADRMAPEDAEALAGRLAEGHWTHDYPISAEEARALGLPISTEMPEAVLELMSLYPQPVRSQPGVEYLPAPHGSRRRPGGRDSR